MSGAHPGGLRTFFRGGAELALFAAAYAAAYAIAMSFTKMAAAPLWLPDAVLLSALVATAPRRWWIFVAATLPIRLLVAVPSGTPAWFLLATFANDSAKALLAAWLLRLSLKDPTRFETLRDLGRFLAIAVLAVPVLSALAGAASRQRFGSPYWPAFRQWVLGDALANLVLTPAILHAIPGEDGLRRRSTPLRLAEAGLLIAGLVAVEWTALRGAIERSDVFLVLLYGPVPFLLWAAIRFGVRGAAGGLCLVSIFTIEAAAQGKGPFLGRHPETAFVDLQLYLLVIGVSTLFLAVLVGERNRSAASLRQSEERYREVVEAQQELICRFLPDSTLTFVNDAYCRYFERSRAQLLGRPFLELIPEPAREAARRHIESLLEDPRTGVNEQLVKRPDGGEGWLQWSNHPVMAPVGSVAEFQAIGRDITDRKRAEEAREVLGLVSRLALLGEITASIAHEINQPLGAILADAEAAEILLDSNNLGPEQLRQILEAIRRNDLRASEVVRQVRSLVRSRDLEIQSIDLNAATAEVLDMVATDAARRGVALQRELDPTLAPVQADRLQVQQALLNLVVNGLDAMAATDPERRCLTVRTVSKEGGAAEIAVVDAGSGFSPDLLPRMFDSFFTTKEQGMGIGLSLCRSIAEAHGGWIAAENNAVGGATFRFNLPATPAAASSGAHRRPVPSTI